MVGHQNFGANQISMQRFHLLVSPCGDFEYLNIIFKTVNGHLIVHEHGIDTIFLIYYF